MNFLPSLYNQNTFEKSSVHTKQSFSQRFFKLRSLKSIGAGFILTVCFAKYFLLKDQSECSIGS